MLFIVCWFIYNIQVFQLQVAQKLQKKGMSKVIILMQKNRKNLMWQGKFQNFSVIFFKIDLKKIIGFFVKVLID